MSVSKGIKCFRRESLLPMSKTAHRCALGQMARFEHGVVGSGCLELAVRHGGSR